MPVLGQVKTSLLALSTALDSDNFFSGLTQLRDGEGRLIFNVCRIGQICKKCSEAGIGWKCTHKNYKLPQWKSPKKNKKLRAFYGGLEHVFMREMQGEIASGTQGAYTPKLLARARALPPYVLQARPRALYWAIDPGGGGPGELGCTIAADMNGALVIVALASISLKGARSDLREKQAVLDLLAAVRAKPLLRDCEIVVMIEAVAFQLPAHICRYIENEPGVTVMHEAKGGKEGVPASNETFAIMKSDFEALLEQDLVRFAADGVCWRDPLEENPAERRTFEKEREKLLKQASNLRFEALKKAHDHDDQRFKLTGKRGSEADDLVISALMVTTWKRRFWASTQLAYEGAKQRIRARAGY